VNAPFDRPADDGSASPAAPQPPAPPREVRLSTPATVPAVTYAIIGLTATVYLLQLVSVFMYGRSIQGLDWLEVYGARINEMIRAGQVWRLLTPVLLHGSVAHIGFNMYALWSFGSSQERYFGHTRFLALYVLSAFAGNVLSLLFMDDRTFSVGASTAVFGLVAAEGVFLYQNRALFGRQFGRAIGNIVFVVVFNLFFLGRLVPNIDNWGHIGGLLGGLIFAWFASPRWELEGIHPTFQLVDRREAREVITGAAAVVFLFGALAFLGMFFPIAR
jgi:rhomboid protease GluP